MKQIEVKDNLKNVKICRISTVSYFLISQLWNQVEYCRDRGMDVMLVSSSGPELSEVEFKQGLKHKIIEIPRSLNLWKDWIAFCKLIYLFSVHKFDIVHSTTPKAGLLTSLAAFIARVPIRIHTWTGQQWVTLNGPIRYISKLADRLIGILNTQCYADSKSQRQFLIDEKIVKPEKIFVIGYGSLAGVCVDRFNSERWPLSEKRKLRESLGILEGSKVLVFIGRITRDKGIAELIAAFLKIINSDYNADLVLVGPLDQECGGKRSIDSDLIKRSSRIHYTGYQQCPEYYLSIADIFCLPSYREGFGSIVIDAAALGLPTIGSNIPGLVDSIEDGKTGILFPVGDIEALTMIMLDFLESPKKYEKMRMSAKARVAEYFTADLLYGALKVFYLELAKKRSCPVV